MRVLRGRRRSAVVVLAMVLGAIALAGCAGGLPSHATESAARESLTIVEDFREQFMHGEKGAAYQRYIVLQDSEGDGTAAELVDYWEGTNSLSAPHFVINKDGSIVQCVPLDSIAHHAGFGDAGHNESFGVPEDGRDDRLGTVPVGEQYPDYGMNSYSVGIWLVHRGDAGEEYPEAQLVALDGLVSYVDGYYRSQSSIIEQRDWRSDSSGCSAEFAAYLSSYRLTRTHDGAVGLSQSGDAADGSGSSTDETAASQSGGQSDA